jgi:hypothetical protein
VLSFGTYVECGHICHLCLFVASVKRTPNTQRFEGSYPVSLILVCRRVTARAEPHLPRWFRSQTAVRGVSMGGHGNVVVRYICGHICHLCFFDASAQRTHNMEKVADSIPDESDLAM